MAAPLLFFLAGSLLRAAGPKIAQELVKAGVKKATKSQIAKGGARVVNNNNLGTIKTVARGNKPGAAPKPAPKPSSGSGTTPKSGSGSGTKPKSNTSTSGGGAKKKPPELKVDPKDRPPSVAARANKKPKSGAEKSKDATRVGLGALTLATTAASLTDSKPTGQAEAKTKPDYSNRSQSQGGRKFGEGTPKKESKGMTFNQAFAKARRENKKTFTWQGDKYAAVTKTEVDNAGIKKDLSDKERLRQYLNKKSGKAKGGYAQKKNIGASDYRMGGMLMSVQDRRKMK